MNKLHETINEALDVGLDPKVIEGITNDMMLGKVTEAEVISRLEKEIEALSVNVNYTNDGLEIVGNGLKLVGCWMPGSVVPSQPQPEPIERDGKKGWLFKGKAYVTRIEAPGGNMKLEWDGKTLWDRVTNHFIFQRVDEVSS